MNGFLIFIIGFALGIFPFLLQITRQYKSDQPKDYEPNSDLELSKIRDYTTDIKSNVLMWNAFSDTVPIHVYAKNADDEFRYVYSNKNRNEFFGKTFDELIGQNDMILLSPENAKKQLAIDEKIMNSPQGIYESIVEACDSQGKKKYFRIAQTQFTDELGTRLLIGAALDITELEESRRLLDESKRQTEERELWLSRTLSSIGDAVIVTDIKGNTVLMNPVAERMLGVTLKDAIGKSHEEIFRIVGAADDEPRQSPVSRALRTGVIVELANNTDLISHTGERYHISDSAAPIMDDRHNILGAVLVFRDVTEVYQRRAALRDAVNDWEMASTVSGIVSFRINYKTRKITGSKRLSEFWPVVNGIAVSPEEWVLPEDLGEGQELMAEVAAGKKSHTFYKYRAMKDGKIRHYRIYGAVDEEHPGEITGIVQDMTEAYENEQLLQNTREMWNRLIDVLPLNFFAKNVDDSFRYSHCNQRFAEFVGKKTEEIIGKTDAELFAHEGESSHFEVDDRMIVEMEKAYNFTESSYGKGQRPQQFQTIKMPCLGPKGERLLIGVSIDITELAALSKSHEVIRQGLEMLVTESDVNKGIDKAMKSVCEYVAVSRCFIFHFNVDQKNVTCVREYCQAGEQNLFADLNDIPFSTQIDWEEHFEKECFFNIRDLQEDEILKELGPFYSDLVKKGDLHSLYCHRLIIDEKFWGFVGLAYKTKIRVLERGELDFVQAAARFIELIIRHKRTQEKLHNAVIQANAAEKAKSSFLAAMSHEIRTPLSAVIGYSELLKDGNLPETEQKDYLKDIAIAGNALLALINDILDLSKLDAGKMQFVKSPTKFSDLVYEISVIFQQKLKEKRLTQYTEIKEMPRVKIDPLRIRQILFNLVGNAVKFTDKGSITICADFVPDAGNGTGTLTFSVKDTGCGISEEDRKQLFQPFVQSRSIAGTDKAGCGTGLGLLLVRRMLDFMNGSISLESMPGIGSIFSVVMCGVEYEQEKPEQPVLVIDQEKPEEVLVSRKILLVDDVPMNLKVMQAMLRKIGMESVVANNAEEALTELEKQPFDLLLTDMWMPGINGMELAEKIRRSGRFPHLGIAIVTADTETGNNFDSKTFDAVFTKPITIEKLKHFIGKFRWFDD